MTRDQTVIVIEGISKPMLQPYYFLGTEDPFIFIFNLIFGEIGVSVKRATDSVIIMVPLPLDSMPPPSEMRLVLMSGSLSS